MACLTTAKMNMLATVLKPSSAPESNLNGQWDYVQDPESGAIERVWIEDDPNTTEYEGVANLKSVPCMVRGIISAGIRGAATTEQFSAIYENIDWIKMTFPAWYNISKRDRITNIRDLNGNIIWKEHEVQGTPASVFNVMGVTPIVNPFGKQIESLALLKRADVQ